MPEFDISASANQVVTLLQHGHAREAAAHLETLRQGQPPAIREALDRFVAARAQAQLAALRQPGAVLVADAASVQPMLDRLARAELPPRFPKSRETEDLTQAQLHDIYASIVATRGNDVAHTALAGQDRVILGLRRENRTTQGGSREGAANFHGKGVYDDRIVVLWTDANGERHAREFHKATTESTAQYDGHAKTPVRSPGFEDVVTRPKTEGSDVNGDGVRDLGRLADGTTEMLATTHPRNHFPDEFALRPSTTAIAAGANRVERDSNGDGWFDSRDVQGVQNLNNTFKIHRGSKYNTDSAGCQTIGNNEYDSFVETVRGTPGQTRWQYVLTSVAPGQTLARDVENRIPLHPANDPRLPQHPDHALLRQIDARLQAMGGLHAERAEAYGLGLLHEAKAANVTRVDQIVVSNATATRAAGETLFLVQGQTSDPAALRVAVSAAELAGTSIDTSLQRLQEQAMQAPATAPELPRQPHAPHLGGR